MHDLPFTYLSAAQHIWHWWMGMWMNGMVSKQGKKKTNLACDSKQAYEAKVQAFINMWMGFKKGGKACETNQANNMRNLD